MGIQINGNNDIISALDGSWTAEGASINTSGILTATTFKGNIVGTAATFTGPVTIGGTLTYEDVTNIDSVGIVTARAGIVDSTLTAGRVVYVDSDKSLTDSANLTFDGNNLGIGAGANTNKPLHIYTGSSDAEIRLQTNSGTEQNSYISLRQSTGDLDLYTVVAGTKMKFFTANSERLRITGTGQFHMGGGSSWTYANQKFVVVEGSNALGMLLQGNNANQGVNLTLQNINNTVNAYSDLSFADDGGQIFGAIRGKVVDRDNNHGEIQIHTSAGSLGQRVTINKDGKVGIGNRTSNPSELLHVHTGSGAAVQEIEGATDATLILRSHSGDSFIKFADASSSNVGRIDYDHGSDSLAFRTNSDERLRITSGGLVQIDTVSVNAGTNGVNAKLQIDSSSQYDGILLGNTATYGTISRGASNGALVYTANASPANLGGGDPVTHEWWSGTGGGGGPNKLMVLTATGKVGIGTEIPATTLDVQGDVAVAYNATHALRFYTQPKNNWSSISNTATDGNANLSIKVSQGEAINITYTKRVGIGTDNPTAALDVRDASGSDPTFFVGHSEADVTGEAIRIGRVAPYSTIRYHSIKAEHSGGTSSNMLAFHLHDGSTATSQTEVVRLKGDGKIGVNGNPDTDGGLFQIKNNMVYTEGTTNLLTSASKAVLRLQTSNNSSKSLFFGGIDESATPYLQVGNKGTGGATATYPLVLQPYGNSVVIGGNGSLGTGNEQGLLDIYHTSPVDINSPHIRLWGPSNQDARIEFGSATNSGEGGYISYNDADEGLYIGSRMSGYAEVHLCTGMNDGSPHSNSRLMVNTVGRVDIKTTQTFDREAHTKGGTVYGGGAASGANTYNYGMMRYECNTPVRGSDSRYSFWIQSGDAYPNASQYLDIDIANASMYRIMIKGSHSSATADIAQFLIYGLANSSGNLPPVIEQITTTTPSFNGDSGGSGSFGNNSGSFSCKVMGYGTSGGTRGSLGTYGTTLRFEYSGNNNQGLVAFIERWD